MAGEYRYFMRISLIHELENQPFETINLVHPYKELSRNKNHLVYDVDLHVNSIHYRLDPQK